MYKPPYFKNIHTGLQLNKTFINIENPKELLFHFKETIKNKRKATFFCLNTYSLHLINKCNEFKINFNKASYILPDGISIVILAKVLLNKNISKVAFNHVFHEYLEEFISKSNLKIFCLGAKKQTIKKAVENLSAKNLNIVGYHDGYFDFNLDTKKIIDKINSVHPDVLFVGLGMPISENWIINNIELINTNCIFSIGGFFDIISNDKKIAPKFLTNSGFEWLFRLIQDPKRLFPRYFVSNLFYIKILSSSLFKKYFLTAKKKSPKNSNRVD